MTDEPLPSPADDAEVDTDDRVEQLEPEGGAVVEEFLRGDEAFAGPDAQERVEDERLEEDARDTGE